MLLVSNPNFRECPWISIILFSIYILIKQNDLIHDFLPLVFEKELNCVIIVKGNKLCDVYNLAGFSNYFKT